MRGHGDGDRRRVTALFATTFQRQAHRVRVRHVALQRLEDGGLQLGGAIAVEQPLQTNGDGAEIGAAFGRADQQVIAGGCGLREAIGSAMRRAACLRSTSA